MQKQRSFHLVSLISCACVVAVPIQAEIIFEQDFSAYPNGPIAQYVDATAPDKGEWNALGASSMTVAVASGALRYTRSTSGYGYFARTTDFGPAPNVLIYRFELVVSGNTAATTAARFQVGSGFGTSGAAESAAKVHSEVGLNFGPTGSFAFRDLKTGVNASTFGGSHMITWVINNSGAPFSYLAPNNKWETVANDRWDLWVDWIKAFDEREATTPAQSLTDINFVFNNGSGTIQLDKFHLENEVPMPAVPEPRLAGLIACALMALAILTRSKSQPGV